MSSDLFPNAPISLGALIESVERELRQRSHVYPRLIAKGRMTQAQSDRETMLMTAVLANLQEQQDD